jgi:hypothetical protein
MFNERRAYNLNKTTRQMSMTEAATGTVLLHLDMTEPDLVRFSKGTFYTMKGRLLEVSDKEWRIAKQAKSNQTIDANGGPVVIG